MNFIKTPIKYYHLNSIPLGWKISYVKYLGNYINGYAFKPDDWSSQGKPILRIQNLSNPNADFNRYEGEISKNYLVRKGDILISWSASLGVYKWLGEDSWLNQHIFKVEINYNLVCDEYFIWLASWFIEELEHKVHGSTMQHLTWNAFGSFPVLLPPIPEQKIIAHYLDQETTKIDELIKAKKRLLELLDEKRRALITHAVTRGLNPDVPMRDSGIEWIGEIPKHWSVQRLKTVSRSLQIGPFGSQLHAEDYIDDGIPVINPVHLVDGKIVPDYQVAVDQETAKRLSIYQLESGDVVFARRGEIGRCGLVTQQEVGWLCGSGSLRVRPNLESLDPEYLVLLVSNTFVGKSLSIMSVGTTMENLNTEIISELIIPLPPLNEQYSIVFKIKNKIFQLNSLKITTEQTIKLLEERRKSLITAAVTGQIKIKE
jgi:type I restriction enzyme S subunit